MAVAIPNYSYRYWRKGKPVFAPSNIGRRIGSEVKSKVEAAFTFDPIYFHLKRGGHVSAMHYHRSNTIFARIDISRFFYSISRRRVQSAMDRVGVEKAAFYAKWSTVANPYDDPKYALPYGFIQSPILASLVMATSQVGTHLTGLPESVNASVYVDDISLSSTDAVALREAFEATLAVLESDGFQINDQKVRAPAIEIDIFNCDLSHGKTVVRDDRIDRFLASNPSDASTEAFVAYCATVEVGNKEAV